MTYVSLVDRAHEILAAVIQPGDFVVDATVGNGYDTVFLASAVGDTGQVLGLDVQKQALENTRRALEQENLLPRVRLVLHSHADLINHIPAGMSQSIKAVMFNLGYLPGSDKSLTTCSAATLSALDRVLPRLAPDGVISVVAYRGHKGGAEETLAVLDWSSRLNRAVYAVNVIKTPASSEKSPLLVVVQNRLQDEYL